MQSENDVINYFETHAKPHNLEGMQKYGIRFKKAYGVGNPVIRELAKKIGKNHTFALELLKSEVHEVKMLASLIADPKQLTPQQMDAWVKEFYSWDICDIACMSLLAYSKHAWEKAYEWSNNNQEFIKRAGFVMIACLAYKDKKATDKDFEDFFKVIIKESIDERNFVKKAVNWALRHIGKRNESLRIKSIAICEQLKNNESKSARWIASDALRELNDQKIIDRVLKKSNKK